MTKSVQERAESYDVVKDRDLQLDDPNLVREENPNPLFRAGQSNRVWGELYKASFEIFNNSFILFFAVLHCEPRNVKRASSALNFFLLCWSQPCIPLRRFENFD